MKKIFVILILFSFLSNSSYSQLEIKDTLLLAYENEIFWSSSSELEMSVYKDLGKYGAINLGDSDPNTCWAEGSKTNGIGEYIWMTIPENTETIRLRNGYQKNKTIYYANNRPKELEFELYAGYEPSAYVTESHNGFFISRLIASTSAKIKDKLGYQDVKLNFDRSEINSLLTNDKTFDKDRFVLKIIISDIYKGTKYNDACISDINIIPKPYYEIASDDHGLLKVSANKTDTLFYNTENIYQVVEISADLHWIIFILMPSDIENSRVETIYKLYNTDKEEFVIIKDLESMYGFVKKDGKIYIEGSNKNLEDKTVLLENL